MNGEFMHDRWITTRAEALLVTVFGEGMHNYEINPDEYTREPSQPIWENGRRHDFQIRGDMGECFGNTIGR